jgi:hypothetical protein
MGRADTIVRRAKSPSTKDFGYMVGEFVVIRASVAWVASWGRWSRAQKMKLVLNTVHSLFKRLGGGQMSTRSRIILLRASSSKHMVRPVQWPRESTPFEDDILQCITEPIRCSMSRIQGAKGSS